MGLFDVTPQLAPLRDYGAETRRTAQAQIKLAPQLYQANETYQPLYGALNLQNMDQFLNGVGEQEYTTYKYSPPRYSDGHGGGGGGFLGGAMDVLSTVNPVFGSLFGSDEKKPQLLAKGGWKKSGTATRAAQRGFLDIYQNDIVPALARAQSTQRAADISDVAKLGPEARAALRLANPDAAKLLDEMYGQAEGDMAAGAALTPAQRRMLLQSVRSGQAARGMGYGPSDVFEEGLSTLDYGRGLQRDRRAYAESTLNDLNRFYGDPFASILNRSSQSAAQGVAGQAGGMSRQGSLFNGESAYAGDIYSSNTNMIQSRNNAEASNNAAILGGIISSIGNAAGGAAGAAI